MIKNDGNFFLIQKIESFQNIQFIIKIIYFLKKVLDEPIDIYVRWVSEKRDGGNKNKRNDDENAERNSSGENIEDDDDDQLKSDEDD